MPLPPGFVLVEEDEEAIPGVDLAESSDVVPGAIALDAPQIASAVQAEDNIPLKAPSEFIEGNLPLQDGGISPLVADTTQAVPAVLPQPEVVTVPANKKIQALPEGFELVKEEKKPIDRVQALLKVPGALNATAVPPLIEGEAPIATQEEADKLKLQRYRLPDGTEVRKGTPISIGGQDLPTFSELSPDGLSFEERASQLEAARTQKPVQAGAFMVGQTGNPNPQNLANTIELQSLEARNKEHERAVEDWKRKIVTNRKGQAISAVSEREATIDKTFNNDAFRFAAARKGGLKYSQDKFMKLDPNDPTNRAFAEEWLWSQKPESLDWIIDKLSRFVNAANPVTGVSGGLGLALTSAGFPEAGKAFEDVAAGLDVISENAADPRQSQDFSSQLASGIGSTASFIIPAAFVASSLRGIGASAKLAEVANMITVGSTGAAQSAWQTYQEARQYGADEEKAREAAGWAALVGTSEIIPVMKWADSLADGTKARRIIGSMILEALEEGGQELGQSFSTNAIAQNIYDKNRDTLEGLAGDAGMGATVGAIVSLLVSAVTKGKGHAKTPSGNPEADAVQADIESRIPAVEGEEEDVQNAELAAFAAQLQDPDLPPEIKATIQKQYDELAAKMGMVTEETKEEVVPVDKKSPLVEQFEEDAGREATQEEAQILKDYTQAETDLETITAQVDEAVMNEVDTPEQQERLKRAQEKLNTLGSRLEGLQPESTEPIGERNQPGSNNWLTEKGRQAKATKWLDGPVVKAVRSFIKPEKGQSKSFNKVKEAYKTGLAPYAQLFAGNNVNVQSETASAQNAGNGLGIEWDDQGNLTLNLKEPEALVSRFGEDLDSEVQNVLPKKLEEEAVHAAFFVALRNEWKKGKGTQGFNKFVNNRLKDYAQDIRRASSDATLKAFTQAYTKGKGKLSDANLSQEFIRAVVQRMRTGQITEDVQALNAQAKAGNQNAGGFLATLVDAIRTVREALVNFINPSTSPQRIRDIIDRTNAILDEFTPADLQSYREESRRPITQGEQNALQEQETTELPVRETPENREEMGEEVRDENTAQEEAVATLPQSEAQAQSTGNVAQTDPTNPGNWKSLSFARNPSPSTQTVESENPDTQEERSFAGAPEDFTPRQAQVEERTGNHIADVLQVMTEEFHPQDTTGTKKKSRVGWLVGSEYPGLQGQVRGVTEGFKVAANYIRRNGPMVAMRRAAANNLGSMLPADKATLRAALLKFFPYYQKEVENSNIGRKDKEAQLSEMVDLRRSLSQENINRAENAGRDLRQMGANKEAFGTSQYAADDYENKTFAAAVKINQVLGRESLAGLYYGLRDGLLRGVDKIFTQKEFLVKLSSLYRKAAKDPKKLLKDIKKSISKSREVAREVASLVLAASANDIMVPDGKLNLKNVADKIVSEMAIRGGTHINPDKVLKNSLERFGRDILQGKFPEKQKDPLRANRLLATIIVNEKYKNEFSKILRDELAKSYKGGLDSTAFKEHFGNIFEDAETNPWSEQMRNRAIDEVVRILQMPIRQAIYKYGDNKKKIKDELRASIGEMVEPEMLDKLINEVDAELDRRAEEYMEKSFGFFRNESGELKPTESKTISFAKILADSGTKLRDLTRMSYVSQAKYVDNLTENYIYTLGLPEDMANYVAYHFSEQMGEAIEWQKDKDITDQIAKILQAIGGPKQKATPKSVIDNLIGMANQGYLDIPLVYEAIRKTQPKLHLQAFSPELAQQVKDMGEVAEGMPEGFLKNEIRTQIANIAAGDVGLADKGVAYFYWSILSGLGTHLANGAYSTGNLFTNSIVMSLENPGRAKSVWANLLQSIYSPDSRAKREFLYVMRTGYIPLTVDANLDTKPSDSAQNPMERVRKKDLTGWAAKIGWGNWFYHFSRGIPKQFTAGIELSPRMMMRGLIAVDSFFRTATEEMSLGSQGVVVTDALQRESLQEAEGEFLANGWDKGRGDYLVKKRADEITQEKLGIVPESREALLRAKQRGMEGALTGPAKGVWGLIARAVQSVTRDYPIARMVVPFTNVPANVLNEFFNYTGLGFIRYLSGTSKIGLDWGIKDSNGRVTRDPQLAIKSMTGLLLLSLFRLLSGDDEENDMFVFYGPGPKDQSERKAWMDRGGKPYSVKMGGKGGVWVNTNYAGPVGQLMGLAGVFEDLRRNNDGKDLTFEHMAASTIMGVAQSTLSQSFLSSVSGLIEATNAPDPGKSFERWVAFQASAPVPNIIKETGRWIDPRVFQGEGLWGQFLTQLPIVKEMGGNQPALNPFGEPVRRTDLPLIGRLARGSTGGETLKAMSQLGLDLPVYTRELNGERMTPQQFREYVQNAGPQIKDKIERAMPQLERLVDADRTEDAQNMVNDIATKVKRDVRQQMLQEY